MLTYAVTILSAWTPSSLCDIDGLMVDVTEGDDDPEDELGVIEEIAELSHTMFLKVLKP